MRALPWLPTILGVVALVVFTFVTILRLMPGQSRTLPPPPEPAFALPGTTSGTQAPISLIPSESAAAVDPSSATPSPARSSAPTRAIPVVTSPPRTTEPARPVTVSGHFHVLNSYADNFIGEVLLTNRTSAGQGWVVTLTYPGNLRTSWLESLPQPTLVQRGHTFTWTSSVPLAAGSGGQMRFQFDKVNGSEAVSGCTVNGNPCT